MDAATFSSVADALGEGAGSGGRTGTGSGTGRVTLYYDAPVDRLLWSMWDYVVGPDLQFAWNVAPRRDTPVDDGALPSDAESGLTAAWEPIDASPLHRTASEALVHLAGDLRICDQCLGAQCDGRPCTLCTPAPAEMSASQASTLKGSEWSGDDVGEEQDSGDYLVSCSSAVHSPCSDDVAAVVSQCTGDTAQRDTGTDLTPPQDTDVDSSMEPMRSVSSLCDEDHMIATQSLSGSLYRSRHHANVTCFEVKLLCMAEKRLCVLAAVFDAVDSSKRRTWHALSLCVPHCRLHWLMERKLWLQQYFAHTVPRLRALLTVSGRPEVVCDVTCGLHELLDVTERLERERLAAPAVHVRDTHLAMGTVDPFVLRAIQVHVCAQGNTVVLGGDRNTRRTMLCTLYVFAPAALRWSCCVGATGAATYSPHIRLQCCTRSSLPSIVTQSVLCAWPLAVVDLDYRRTFMAFGGDVLKQSAARLDAAKDNVRRTLGLEPVGRKLVTVPMVYVRWPVASALRSLSGALQLLPAYDEQARIALVASVCNWAALKARALVQYARTHTSNGRLDVPAARRALDLRANADYHWVLAAADRLMPAFAAYVTQCDR